MATEQDKKEVLEPRPQPSETTIQVKLGLTISLAQYESARVDASVSKTIMTNSRNDVDRTFAALWSKVEQEVNDEATAVRDAYLNS